MHGGVRDCRDRQRRLEEERTGEQCRWEEEKRRRTMQETGGADSVAMTIEKGRRRWGREV